MKNAYALAKISSVQSKQEPVYFGAVKLPIMLKFNTAIHEHTFSR